MATTVSSNIDWSMLKLFDNRSRNVVFGFLNLCQQLISPSRSQYTLYDEDEIPDLVKNLCLIFHDEPEFFMVDRIYNHEKENEDENGYQIECKQVDDGYFIYNHYNVSHDVDHCLKYNQTKQVIECIGHPSVSIMGSVEIFNGNTNHNKYFVNWWRFKILKCNYISIGIINRNNSRLYMLSSVGRLNGEYFNKGYNKNDLVEMFVNLSCDLVHILLYFSVNGGTKKLKKIKYEKGSIYQMIVFIGGCIKLLNYSTLCNIKNNKNYNDNNNSLKNVKTKYVPSNYKCFKCGTIGKHWITDC